MWDYFIALPLVARIVSLLGVAVLAGLGLLKRKTIAAFTGALVGAARERFWNYVRKNVVLPTAQSAPSTLSNQKTYRGKFQGYFTYENYPRESFFELVQDGVIMKVPVWKTNFFSGVQPGAFVEVDTEIIPTVRDEIVRRVRVVEK